VAKLMSSPTGSCFARWPDDGLYYAARVVHEETQRGVLHVIFEGFEDDGAIEVPAKDVFRGPNSKATRPAVQKRRLRVSQLTMLSEDDGDDTDVKPAKKSGAPTIGEDAWEKWTEQDLSQHRQDSTLKKTSKKPATMGSDAEGTPVKKIPKKRKGDNSDGYDSREDDWVVEEDEVTKKQTKERQRKRKQLEDEATDDLPGAVKLRRGKLSVAQRKKMLQAWQDREPPGAVVIGTTPRSVRRQQMDDIFGRFSVEKGWANLKDMAHHIVDNFSAADRSHLLDRFYKLI